MKDLNILLGILPFLALLYIHAVRESVHTVGRMYLRDLAEGNGPGEGALPTSDDQARTVLALRLSRVIVLAVWAFMLWWVMASWQAVGTGGVLALVLILVGDEGARMVGQWVSIRFPVARARLERHARWLTWLLFPLVALFWFLSRRVFGLEPVRDVMLAVNEDQIVIMAREDAVLPMQPVERKLIDNIFDFRETIVREIMVPRLDIIAVPVDTSLKEALDVIVQHGHSRIPVYEGSIDNIQGILYAKDILQEIRNSYPNWPETPLREILREPYFVPDSKRVSELLTEMQTKKVHMAIVVDEYGGTAGLITIEDLLEEIVGEIQDEYDRETPEIQEIGKDEYLVNARADLEDVSETLGVPLPEEEADTLGGLIYAHLKRMPRPGEVIELPGVELQVLTMDGRRIQLVRVRVKREDLVASPPDGRGNHTASKPVTEPKAGDTFNL